MECLSAELLKLLFVFSLKSELEHDKEAAIVSLDSAKRALEEEQRGRAEVTERSHVDISGLKDQIEQLRDELLLSQK